jgi:AcrR family transcriptional regulator
MKKASLSRSHSEAAGQVPARPRKTPVQARSTATVLAICEATIQVLLERGASRLTTTHVSQRAGVSVGTLYQYFPNKKALLHEVLRQHLTVITEAVERACAASHGCPVEQMARAIALAFIDAKLRDAKRSVALYSVADFAEARTIMEKLRKRATRALVTMLQTAPGVEFHDPETTVLVLYSAMAGAARSVLEAGAGPRLVESCRRELVLLAEGHLTRACQARTTQARVAGD